MAALSRQIPIPLLRKLIDYDYRDGSMYWMVRTMDMFHGMHPFADCRRWNVKYANKEAFTSFDNNGYRQSSILGYTYKGHQVAWALHYGVWPTIGLDHKNHDRGYNAILNLELATQRDNLRNRKDAGIKQEGANWHETSREWRVRKNGQLIGVRRSLREAKKLYDITD